MNEQRAGIVAECGIFIAMALVVSYLETLIPFSVGIPGVKLGLANGVVMVLLYRRGIKEALIVSLFRIVLASALFSGFFTMVYSLSGALLSLFAMYLLKRSRKLHILGISVAGGVMHNIGQILVAMLVVENGKMIFYFPVLLVSGVLSGVLVGILVTILIERTRLFS